MSKILISACTKNNKCNKTKEFDIFLCKYLKNNICDIRLIPLDHIGFECPCLIFIFQNSNFTQLHELSNSFQNLTCS